MAMAHGHGHDHGHDHGHGHGPPGRPMRRFQKIDFVKSQKEHFSEKKHKNRANLASGRGGNDSTRREALDAPNESSAAALGASLVTKQAGRVPQHD